MDLTEYWPPPAWMVWAIAGLCSLAATTIAARATIHGIKAVARALQNRRAPKTTKTTPPTIEDVLTWVMAGMATAVSASGMWKFAGDVLQLEGFWRVLFFAFIEGAIVISALRARRSMRESYTAGLDGIAVWALAGLTAVLASLDTASTGEVAFRLAAPLVAAWLWERGMQLERRKLRGLSGINWRLTPERILVRLGLAEATDRTAGEVDAHRKLTRVALAIKKVRALQQADASQRKLRAAFAKLDKAMDAAVEYAGLAVNETRQKALLAQIDTLYSTGVLVKREKVPAWADPVTQEKRADAISAIEDAQRFDTAEATQRALDKAALTLMELTKDVTSDVTSRRVNGALNNGVNGGVVSVPRRAEKLSPPVTSGVTSELTPALTVERVNPALNFDVTNPASYALETSLGTDPYVTPALSGGLTATALNAALNIEVNDDPEDASKTQVMEDFWRSEIAEDRYPSVKDLAEHAGVHPSHASRKRKEWVADLPWWKRRKAEPKRTSKVTDAATSTPNGDQS